MSTPAAPATPVAPAAAPAVPAASAAPAVPATPPAALAVPAAPAAPAAAPAASAAPPAAVDSLLPADAPAVPAVPQTDAEKLAAAKAVIAAAEAAADPNGGKAWLLYEGVMGTGEKPAWFKQDKYRTVSAQAEAYTSLEKRFGSFTGAPAEGKYTLNLPENVAPGTVVDQSSPLFSEFNKWAGEHQLSQEGYNQLLGFLAQDVAGRAPNLGQIKARLGENADSRIASVAQWGKANLGADYETLRAATSGANADAVFKVLEKVIAQTAQVRMPRPGDDVPGGAPGAGLDAIRAAHGAKTADGKLRVDVEPAYRLEIDKRYRDHFAAQAA